MTRHLFHSRKYFTAFLGLVFFVVCLLMFPTQTLAQRERRVQIFFMYSPTSPSPQQEVQFKDFSRGNPTSWLWDFGDGTTSILQNPSHKFTASGNYRVTLTARNNSSSGRTSRTLKVVLSLYASFTRSPSNPVVGQEAQFTDTSTGSPTSWQWDFGDGATSTLQNPSHAYTKAASYTVSFTVANSAGSKSTSQTVNVAPALTASFTYSPTSPVAGQAVQFTDTSTGSPTSWQWSSGDGATSTSQNPSHTYTTAGSYTVTLTVVYSTGSKSASQTINVLPPAALSASFTYSPSSPVAGQAVQFTDTSTGSPTSWLWNFGDSLTSTSKSPSHAYTAAGSYTVTLTATNSTASKSTSQTINVLPASTFTASFTYSPSSPAAGQVVYFTDTSTGSPTSWQWNFGDGATSTTRNPSHAYSTAASYTVTLTVTNSSDSKSASQTITVLPTFAASFTYSPSSPAANQAVQFTDTSTGSPTSWQWNFGDSATSTIQNPSHKYAAAGSYWVNLIITKGADSHSASQLITVRQPGVITAASPSFADVSAAIASASPGDTVKVPAGSATWNSQLVITKGIKLIGAGIGNTVITGNYYMGVGSSIDPWNHLIVYQPSSPALNEPFRFSGFTVDCDNKCLSLMLYNTGHSPLTKVRVDHNRFLGGVAYHTLMTLGAVWGVADNNVFVGATVSMDGDDSEWSLREFNFGTADMFYLEDNTWIAIAGSDALLIRSEIGARWCSRHNVFDGTAMTAGLWPWHDAHGNLPNAWHSVMGIEIYENTLNHIAASQSVDIFDQRGGKALVYNNTINTPSSVYSQLREEYNDSGMPPANNLISGQPQHISDSYYWNNLKNGVTRIDPAIYQTVNYGGDTGLVPQFNRDCWKQVDSFNGTTGMGVGPLSARPTTCIKGTAYWATDTKTLYKCTATNTWIAYYTPYTYPHPLRTSL